MILSAWPKLAVFAADGFKQPKAKSHTRNLPDIELTALQSWALEQELNFNSAYALSNTSLDYGVSEQWNLGFSLLNTQFYATTAADWAFQPDVLFNAERHWQFAGGRVVAGSHLGTAFLDQGASFIHYSYLEFQQRLSDWAVDFDVGSYLSNAGLAWFTASGLHLNLELPLLAGLRLNADYLSGNNALSSGTFKLIYALNKDWEIALGMQIATASQTTEAYQGMLGIYFH